MIRSKTSITGPTPTDSPVSSATSRATADSSVSPVSTTPPGRLHSPASGSSRRLISTTPAAGSPNPAASAAVTYITAPTPTTGRVGYERSVTCTVRCAYSHHLHHDALLALPVELRVENLLPWAE